MIFELELAMAQKCFFEAMLKGYAGGGRAVAVREMPGYKEYIFSKGDYLVVDQYGSIGEKSTGTTTILVEDEPVWFMSYMGYYRKEDLPFLKSVLKRTYEKGEFIGGRGPLSAMSGDLVYTNKVSEEGSSGCLKGSFDCFKGEESICDQTGLRGCHSYWGTRINRPQ